jgi:hypothetical protein
MLDRRATPYSDAREERTIINLVQHASHVLATREIHRSGISRDVIRRPNFQPQANAAGRRGLPNGGRHG